MSIFESDGSGLVIDVLAAGRDVSTLDRRDVWTVSHVIDDDFAWNTLAFFRGRGVKETFVHVLAMEHVIDVTPSGLVVVQVVLVKHTAGLPVTHDELLKNHGFHRRDVDFPLPEPLGTLNKKSQVAFSSEH